jgi:hypothetical protein
VLAHLRDVRRQFNHTSDNAATVAMKTQPNLVSFDFSTLSASSAEATTAPPRSKKAPTPWFTHERREAEPHLDRLASAVRAAAVREGGADKRDVMDSGVRFKPALNVRGQCNFASHHRHMFPAHIHAKLQLIRTVQSAPMSLQSKFACLRSLDSGLRWKVMATSPAITAPTVAVIDDAVSSAVFSSCIDGSIPTHKSKALITIPTALGGLGWTNYAQDSERIFDLTTAHCCWRQHGTCEPFARFQTPVSQIILRLPLTDCLGGTNGGPE